MSKWYHFTGYFTGRSNGKITLFRLSSVLVVHDRRRLVTSLLIKTKHGLHMRANFEKQYRIENLLHTRKIIEEIGLTT